MVVQCSDVTPECNARLGSADDHIYSEKRPLDDEFPELVGVNPHYVPGAPQGVNTNCVSSANATQQRLLGVNTNAVAEESKGYGTPNDLLESAPFGFQSSSTPEEVKEQMCELGDGAVGVLRVEQGGPVEHVINVVNRDGKIYFIDGQSGHIVELQPNVTVKLGVP